MRQFTSSLVEGAPPPWLRSLQPALHSLGTPLVCTLRGHSERVESVAVSADGRLAVSASSDRIGSSDSMLKVWDLETGREVRSLTGHSGPVVHLALSPDGRRAVSASRDRTLNVWDLERGAVVTTFTCDAAALCCAWTGDRRIVAGDESGRVHFLSLELGRDKLTNPTGQDRRSVTTPVDPASAL